MASKKKKVSVRPLRAKTIEVSFSEMLKWKLIAHQQSLEKAQLMVKQAQNDLQQVVDEIKGTLEVPEGYEAAELDFAKAVAVCKLKDD
jgi:hypothetical protein